MSAVIQPFTSDEMSDVLRAANASRRTIELFGGNSKHLMAGAPAPADIRISTLRMKSLLQYEPRDLTISVESGMLFADLNALLARNGQTIPLDGPYCDSATVGGVVAANISGARRRLYGTARDLVIGMKFATLDGKLVQSGGMVVKNVAGLDMGKLMIGSFGTLAAIVSVNFKLTPRPAVSRTILFAFEDLPTALEARNAAIRGQLNPIAVEILNPILSAQLGLKNFTLAVIFAGNEAVMERSIREAAALGAGRPLPLDEEQRFWTSLHSVTPKFLEKFRDGAAVVKISTRLAECGDALQSIDGPAHAHAASGVVRGWFTRPETAGKCAMDAVKRGWKAVVEFSSEAGRPGMTLWPEPGGDFAIMKEIKRMFDPENLLNRGRLFGQI
ncbi:MAG TPA: FAD-binding oxidoreductase [Bryobacteraceae bacterium]|nr:FAD-binding oxidoreductase [Bryobacteraceae bacterium]